MTPIAIVGRAVRFPAAGSDLSAFWAAVAAGRDLSSDVPAGRWAVPPAECLQPGPPAADKVYSARGYFLAPFAPDLTGLMIPPDLVAGLDPLFHLVLDAGGRAWREAVTEGIDRRKAGVILGNICLPTDAASDLARQHFGVNPPDAPPHPLNRHPAGLPAGLLAKALGLGGGAMTLDAACASTLYAIALAADELASGRADVMLAGGVSRPDCLYTQMGFSQLRALSPTGTCSPFDAAADGLVVGEGVGIFVLKRLPDAVAAGDTIHAVLAGWGLSNDTDGNLLAPAKEGQLRAMRAAYRRAGWEPGSVDLVECHATGTPVGDAVEFESLRELWGNNPGPAVIGSVKSTVGHLLTGAGAAAVAKVTLAFKNRMLPPQANFRTPNPNLAYDGGPFRVLEVAEPWKATAGRPRRAAVSGFGFGGVNAHLLFEEWSGTSAEPDAVVVPAALHAGDGIAVVGLAAHVGPWETAKAVQEFALGGGVAHPAAAKIAGWPAAQVCPPGYFVENIRVPVGAFRVPPVELEEMLPQQLLMLTTAAAAVADCRGTPGPDAVSTGVFVGLGQDMTATNFHLRWSGAEGPPPLTANRVMGALGSITASRIARLFRCGGPAFTLCSEESSSARAVELAVRALRNGDIDRAIVGGVELAGDPRALLPAVALDRAGTPADGAAAVVLKRLADAERDGDRIYAVIRGVGVATGGPAVEPGPTAAAIASSLVRACADANLEPTQIDYLDAPSDPAGWAALAALGAAQSRETPLAVGDAAKQVGNTGFAAGAVALVKTCLALYQQILPATVEGGRPQFWLANAGPRRAAVGATGVDGSSVHILLEDANSAVESERQQPLGARGEGVFAVEGDTAAELRDGLARLATWLPADRNIEAAARDWSRRVPADPRKQRAVTFVARSIEELAGQIATARGRLATHPDSPFPPGNDPASRDRVFTNPYPVGRGGKLAFVFPGSGNQFAGMGRDHAVQWPQVLRKQQSENARLRDQVAPHLFWGTAIPPAAAARDMLFGQVTLGCLTADLLAHLGVKPDAMIGQSLGESAGLFGTRVWLGRDEMYRRISESTLFTTDLGAPYDAARRFYAVAEIDWVTGVLAAPADAVRDRLVADSRAYLLIVTTPNECVIGGVRAAVEALVADIGKPFLPLSGVTLAHCEAGKPVEPEYRALHTLPTTVPHGLKVYSGAWGRAYDPTPERAADSITAGLVGVIDFPRAVEAAYRDGVRGFVEVGPGNSCVRAITQILGDRPHAARAVCAPRQDAVSQVLRTLAELVTERFPVTLAALYANDPAKPAPAAGRELVLPTGIAITHAVPPPVVVVTPVAAPVVTPVAAVARVNPFVTAAGGMQTTAAAAHAAFLAVQDAAMQTAVRALQLQTAILQRMMAGAPSPVVIPVPPVVIPVPAGVPRSLTFAQCTAYAVGKIADVLGPDFAEVDTFPTRVRLPEGPLMLVDRVLSIEGEPKSLGAGRVITDHAVRADRWYLDAGRCPTSVAVESGQADLFLAGFLGIDFHTRGEAVYRLLDAVVTFHRGLPAVGERIEYDIRVDEFFRQADAILFRFRFEGTVNGEPLLSMQNGIAGFFTADALAAGKGIVHTELDKQPQPGKTPPGWAPLVPVERTSLDEAKVDALRRGDLATAFGPAFAGVNLKSPMTLPGGMLRLVDRVPIIDPAGGRFGLGFVRAEYDIRPREWFIECHFIDDKVMPGTLMYECCLHTLRIFLMRLGWVGEAGTVCEPVPGVKSRLKCRGQVLDTTATVTYEVSVKELGYGPDAFCVADALMYADGKPVVEITNLSLRMAGVTRETLAAVWAKPAAVAEKVGVYDNDRIMAYSNGSPSAAFGEPYRVFDRDRVIARLPGPPYQFLDRVTDVTGEPFVLKAGAACEAEYRVPADAWYFAANRCPRMPFSILLEVALQPCGWLAAYCGSALTSPVDLSFRNLGGKGTQFAAIGPDAGTLTTNVALTGVSQSAGMVIQNYSLNVSANGVPVYDGTTYFGFFTKDALKTQVGMPAAKVPYLTADQAAFAGPDVLPHDAPFPDKMLRMVDRIDGYLPRGGAAGLGLVQGRIAVDPAFWFFDAHFYQDPVWPGSLGLESFLQLLKYAAYKKYGPPPGGGWQAVAIDAPHEWTYRGQVLRADREVTVVLEITAEDRTRRRLTANGFLVVDGRVIYQMTGFTLE